MLPTTTTTTHVLIINHPEAIDCVDRLSGTTFTNQLPLVAMVCNVCPELEPSMIDVYFLTTFETLVNDKDIDLDGYAICFVHTA